MNLSQRLDVTRTIVCIGGLVFPLEPPPEKSFPHEDVALRRHNLTARIHVRDSKFYNCTGLVFASRRGWITDGDLTEPVHQILQSDGYQATEREQLRAGDVVVYTREQQIEHVAVVTGLRHPVRASERMVLSKFGPFGEYLHPIDDVPEELGRPSSYWSQEFPE